MNEDSTSMDLVSDLPRTPSIYEVVWVIMDEMIRFVYFFPFRMDCPIKRIAKSYLEEVVSCVVFYSDIGIVPFEELFDRRCRVPLCWHVFDGN